MRPTGQAWRRHATNGQQDKPGTTDQFTQPDPQTGKVLVNGLCATRENRRNLPTTLSTGQAQEPNHLSWPNKL